MSQTSFWKIRDRLRESRKGKETDQSMALPNANLAPSKRSSDVDLDAVIDNDLFCQDPDAWCGKAIFDNELAALIHKKSVASANFTLLDVLQTVAACYQSPSLDVIEQDTGISSFYRYLYGQSCELDEDSWTALRHELSHQISVGCEKLRKEKTAELPASLVAPNSGSVRNVPPAGASGSSENSRSPSSSSSIATASSSMPAEARGPTDPLLEAKEPFQTNQTSQPAINYGSATIGVVPDNRYITYVWEHAQARGLAISDENNCLETTSRVFFHKVTYDGVSGEGTGRNGKLAKQAAYKQLCELKSLRLF